MQSHTLTHREYSAVIGSSVISMMMLTLSLPPGWFHAMGTTGKPSHLVPLSPCHPVTLSRRHLWSQTLTKRQMAALNLIWRCNSMYGQAWSVLLTIQCVKTLVGLWRMWTMLSLTYYTYLLTVQCVLGLNILHTVLRAFLVGGKPVDSWPDYWSKWLCSLFTLTRKEENCPWWQVLRLSNQSESRSEVTEVAGLLKQ